MIPGKVVLAPAVMCSWFRPDHDICHDDGCHGQGTERGEEPAAAPGP